MENQKIKRLMIDLLADIAGGFLIAIGVYNFAAVSEFPVAGISGIALIFYHFFKDLNASAETVNVLDADSVSYPVDTEQSFVLYRKGI